MSVLVKDMEMPKECRECPMCEYYEITGNTWCKSADGLLAENYKPISFDGIPEWCPLVELPEKHGDLIDRGKLLRDVEKYHVSDGRFQQWVQVQRPVIEAEGE